MPESTVEGGLGSQLQVKRKLPANDQFPHVSRSGPGEGEGLGEEESLGWLTAG